MNFYHVLSTVLRSMEHSINNKAPVFHTCDKVARGAIGTQRKDNKIRHNEAKSDPE